MIKYIRGEVSKSGTAILPSKRVRKIPEKVDNDSTIQDVKIDNKNEELKQQIETASLPTDNKSELPTDNKSELPTDNKSELPTDTKSEE